MVDTSMIKSKIPQMPVDGTIKYISFTSARKTEIIINVMPASIRGNMTIDYLLIDKITRIRLDILIIITF